MKDGKIKISVDFGEYGYNQIFETIEDAILYLKSLQIEGEKNHRYFFK